MKRQDPTGDQRAFLLAQLEEGIGVDRWPVITDEDRDLL